MNTHIPYTIKTNGSITLYLNGECLTVATDHPNYNKIVEAIKTAQFDQIENLVNVSKAVQNYTNGRVKIENGQIFYSDFAVHSTLSDRIIKMMVEGFKFDHMIKFLENVMENPSKRAVDETYWFLENFGLPITDDGCFLAYKAVRNDYTDIYSGKFNNNIGSVVSMPRNRVDDNYGIDCSHGLHVGALDYVVGYGHFKKGEAVPAGGNRLLLVKVNPKNVVSVPKYDSHTKMRVCEYTVVSEINDVVKELDKVVYTSNAGNLDPDYDDGDWDDEEYSSNDVGVGPYDEGFNIGRDDSDDGFEYGASRDYSKKGDYLKGYNDGYNNRDYNMPEEENHCASGCDCSESTDVDDEEYNNGFRIGGEDYTQFKSFGYSLKKSDSQMYNRGYEDGWNQALNKPETT
jgi:hypothetical protein